MAMVYLYDQMESFDDACLEQALSLISSQRRAQVLNIHNKTQQKQSVMVYLLLNHALEKEFQIARNPLLDFSDNGKPRLAEHPEIHFNLSHCAHGVACIVGTTPVGIDIEKIGTYKPDLAAYVTSPEELSEIQQSGNMAESFIRLWTKKESYLKCIGIGIFNDIQNVFKQSVPYHFETLINQEKSYVCTACTQEGIVPDFMVVKELLAN